MFQKIQLIGHAGGPAEVTDLNSGKTVGTIRLACNETWKNAEGQKMTRVHWFTVVAFQNGPTGIVENIMKLVRKGMPLFIDGTPKMRGWTAQDGSPRTTFEVHLGPGDTIRLLGQRPTNGHADPAVKHDADGVIHDDIPFGEDVPVAA